MAVYVGEGKGCSGLGGGGGPGLANIVATLRSLAPPSSLPLRLCWPHLSLIPLVTLLGPPSSLLPQAVLAAP